MSMLSSYLYDRQFFTPANLKDCKMAKDIWDRIIDRLTAREAAIAKVRAEFSKPKPTSKRGYNNATAEWKRLIEEKSETMPRHKAITEVNKLHPGLRQAMVEQANAR
jgi:nitrate/TMAO reductase-like tetraheme cytochrome c subunit